MTTATPSEERLRALSLLRRHGYNSTSFQVLEEGFRYWFDGDDACVAFADTGSAWVVAGAPIAPTDRLPEVATRFQGAAREARRRVCYFAVEERMLSFQVGPSIAIGAQPVWNPADWPETLRGASSLREQIRRAKAKGVSVRRPPPEEMDDPAAGVRREVGSLIDRWLASKEMAPMGFLVDVQPFSFAAERRYFVAERDGRAVGFLAAVPVYARGGWLFEDLLRDASAPNGTAELLVDAAMRDPAIRDSAYVTLGLAPLRGDADRRLLAVSRLTGGLYDFDGLHRFKAKLRPQRWDPIHVVCAPGTPALAALFDTLTAFAGGSLSRYGLATVLRGPSLVVRALALLLLPWTALLLAADAARWFPSPAAKAAWIALDVALALSLWSLSSRWRHALATTLAVAVTLDALGTVAQALAFNAPRARGWADAAVLLVACAVPTFVAVMLWRARDHRRPPS